MQSHILYKQIGKTLNTSIRGDKGYSAVSFRKNKRILMKTKPCDHFVLIIRFMRFIGAG